MSAPKPRVLIVEDETLIAADLEDTLVDLGMEVVSNTGTAVRALQATRDHQPDVVLMDVNLGGPVDGIEAARRIRMETTAVIVFLTAHGDPSTLERASAVEPAGYLIKPFDRGTLNATLSMAFTRVGADRERRSRHDTMRETLDLVGDPLFRVDPDSGRVSLTNEAARDRGLRRGESLGRALEHLDLGTMEGLLQRHLAGEPVTLPPSLQVTNRPSGAMVLVRTGEDRDVVHLCAWCHRARSGETWTTLAEALVKDHGLAVSHGLCNTCVSEHFADLSNPPE